MPPIAFQDWAELLGPWRAMMWFNKNQFSRVNKFGTAVERSVWVFAAPTGFEKRHLRRSEPD
ncbi:MAG: hypothetical protein WAJ91_13245, partial [Rhodoplanes sp.]